MNWLLLGSALWLGILTAISPCPLATNIAAVSFIGRQMGNDRSVLFSGMLYVAGRVIAYLLLGIGITAGLMAGSDVSRFLQQYMNEMLGPILILLGMVLLGMLGSRISLNLISHEKLHKHTKSNGVLMAMPLGFIFALSFCPVSAGLFFGALIPLTLKNGGSFVMPTVYGIGTALPVIIFSFLIAFGGEYLGKAFHCLTRVEAWMRRIAGVLFIVVGIYYCINYIYQIRLW